MDDHANPIRGLNKANPEFVATIFAIEAATRGLKPQKKQKVLLRIKKHGQELRQQGATISLTEVRRQGLELAKRDQTAMARAGECLLAALTLQTVLVSPKK